MPFWKRKNQESSRLTAAESADYTTLYKTKYHSLRVRLKYSTNQIDFVLDDHYQRYYTDNGEKVPGVFEMINEKPEIEGWCPVCQPKDRECYLRLFLKMKGGKPTLFWEHTNVPMHDDYRGCGQSFRVMTLEERNQSRKSICNECIHYEAPDEINMYTNTKDIRCKHVQMDLVSAKRQLGYTNCSGFRSMRNQYDSQFPTQSQIGQWVAEISRVQPHTEKSTTKKTGMHCSSCGRVISKGQDYCSHCGTKKVDQAPHCMSCGARIPRRGRYCAKCGTEQ
jgi:hypothetical protein